MQLEHFQCLLLATLLLVTVFSNKLYKITSSLLQFLFKSFSIKKKYHLTFRWMVGNGKGLFNLYRFTASLGKIP